MEGDNLLKQFLESNFNLCFFIVEWKSETRVKIKEKKGHKTMTFFFRDELIKNGSRRFYQQARNGIFVGFNK